RPYLLFNDTAPTQTDTLSLHDALPISGRRLLASLDRLSLAAASTQVTGPGLSVTVTDPGVGPNLSDVSKQRVAGSQQIILDRDRSEEHTSELQSRSELVCRLLLEKNTH